MLGRNETGCCLLLLSSWVEGHGSMEKLVTGFLNRIMFLFSLEQNGKKRSRNIVYFVHASIVLVLGGSRSHLSTKSVC